MALGCRTGFFRELNAKLFETPFLGLGNWPVSQMLARKLDLRWLSFRHGRCHCLYVRREVSRLMAATSPVKAGERRMKKSPWDRKGKVRRPGSSQREECLHGICTSCEVTQIF